MPDIAVKPIILTDCIVQIGADDYAAAVNSVTITPTTSTVTFTGLKPGATFTGITPAVWALALSFAQDHVTPGSLSNYLYDNEGLTKEAIIKPQTGAGPSYAVSIVITPGAIGGAGGAVAVSTVTLGVQGRPERIAAGTVAAV